VSETQPTRQPNADRPPHPNAVVNRVGPGSPAGEYFRCFWLPVALTDQPCDLDPKRIGREPSYRITPTHSSPWAISNRLRQLGYPKSLYGDKTFIREIRILMAEANIAGRRAVFDEPDELGKLVDAAQGRISGRDRVAAD
jgi:hypothetical protein